MVKKEGKDRDRERAGRSGVGKEGKEEVEGLGSRWRAWSGRLTEAMDSPAKGRPDASADGSHRRKLSIS